MIDTYTCALLLVLRSVSLIFITNVPVLVIGLQFCNLRVLKLKTA